MKSIKVAKSKTPKTTAPKSERAAAPVQTPVIMTESNRATTTTTTPVVTPEEIARRAYAIWEGQGRPAGKATEHWLQAETQLKTSQSFSE